MRTPQYLQNNPFVVRTTEVMEQLFQLMREGKEDELHALRKAWVLEKDTLWREWLGRRI